MKMCYEFPMRDNFVAQVVIPLNMTKKEAERLSAFILTLVIPPEFVRCEEERRIIEAQARAAHENPN